MNKSHFPYKITKWGKEREKKLKIMVEIEKKVNEES
jgi:hypothetical protein